jgi:hypothetical protein
MKATPIKEPIDFSKYSKEELIEYIKSLEELLDATCSILEKLSTSIDKEKE